MILVDLEHSLRLDVLTLGAGHLVEDLLHTDGHIALAGKADGVILQGVGVAHLRHLVADTLLHEFKELLGLIVLFLELCLLFLIAEVKVIGTDIEEVLVIIIAQDLDAEFVDILGQVQHLISLGEYALHLREHGDLLDGLSDRIIDLVLILSRTVDIFF